MDPSTTGATPAAPPLPPGAQRERTALAWQRTLLGVVAGSLVLAMTAIRAGAPALVVASGILTVYVAARLLHRGPAHELRAGRSTVTWVVLLQVAVVVAMLGVLGAVMSLLTVVGAVGRG